MAVQYTQAKFLLSFREYSASDLLKGPPIIGQNHAQTLYFCQIGALTLLQKDVPWIEHRLRERLPGNTLSYRLTAVAVVIGKYNMNWGVLYRRPLGR